MCFEINEEETNVDLACVVLERNRSGSPDQQSTMALKSTQSEVGIDEYVWIGDTRASSHMTHSKEGMKNMREIKSWIIFGNGQRLQSTHVGDKHGTAVQKDGMRTSIFIKDVKYVPELFCNLFSIPMALRNECTLEGSKDSLVIKKDKNKYFFDKKIRSGKGILFGIEIMGEMDEDKLHEKAKIIDIMKYHEMLGHASKAMTRSTAARMNVRLKGEYAYCDGCSQGKMRQKNIPKMKVKQANSPGDRIFLDISSIKYESLGGARFWVLMMDDCTGFLSSFFLKRKSDLKNKGIFMLKKIENNYNLKIKRVRCDNAGENTTFEEECINHNMRIKFEYTSPGTPQQNGRIERKFATLYGRVHSMFIAAGIEGQLRKRLWAEAANTAAMIDNITVNQGALKSPYELFNRENGPPRYAQALKIFGEIGVVMNKKGQMKSKLINRGKKAMMVGYHEQSAMGVYRMYNFNTGNIIQTRNVRWSNQKYSEHRVKEDLISESSSEDEEALKEDDDDQKKEKLDEAASKRLESALRKLHTFYNPTELGSFGLSEDFCFVGGTDDEYDNPSTFDEAWDHKIDVERKCWRDAIKKEFSDMIRRGVWRHTKRDQIPSDRRLIGNKWVFKRKKNGMYRARLVGLGYSQVPGIDHKDNFSPVINEVTFRCVMVLTIQNNWVSEIVDVVTAFLYGDLEELTL